ncbi:hypothetical protein CC78DRAFT_529150 [Lojkania enalia]|uniref:tRNA-splicing endonuclease subunit Sen2 n=1 Tax=Lojkania enalia TaxID=147567 RepID=A0A9P4NA09_9PLEO|nr:hypothetical protein CC78DRAFT_529150 [Didymosphaeria enalia]
MASEAVDSPPSLIPQPNGNGDRLTVDKKNQTSLENKLKPIGPKRRPYTEIHSRPLPLEVHPLPVFIPHNPLSFVRIAINLISHSFRPPSSHPTVHRGYFSTETQSIHVTNPQSIVALWEQGFWGSGSLSRTEPQWLEHEKRKRGLGESKTAWEVTQERREARRQFKLERARLERETIEQQLRQEGKLASTEQVPAEQEPVVPVKQTGAFPISDANKTKNEFGPTEDSQEDRQNRQVASSDRDPSSEEIEDQEHLQLTLEEAFFLTYGLGALEISKDEISLSSNYLFRLYSTYSNFPIPENSASHIHNLFRLQEQKYKDTLETSDVLPIAPDNPFLLKYVVYHHFRSLGWVVRDGVKFASDYLLYNRGPVFAHAQFAVMILPSYSHPYWSATPDRKEESKKKEARDWWWLHRVNRIQTQVLKTLVLVYVEVPPPWDEDLESKAFQVNIGNILKKYKVREVVMQRWTPNRNRD